MVLGHPLFTFPVGARLKVQSIGSGAKYSCQADTIRGWDLSIELSPDQKPGYNPLSLLEIWIEDEAHGASIYGFAKYVQAIEHREPIALHDAG
jgi:hypothetical protein